MHPFTYIRTAEAATAVQQVSGNRAAKFIAGGTNLLDLMKAGVERPERLVDIDRLPLAQIEALPRGGVRIGALARNSQAANHPLIRERFPVLTQAFLSGASGQIRNMASVGGNLMQRTRCPYFYDRAMMCNKREPGSGCSAIEGVNRTHALLGTSDHCIAAHPSDMCVALAALGAVIRVKGHEGEREIPINEFHRLPGDTPHIETNLRHGELITAVDLPELPFAKRSYYLKVRDRASYEFALVSVAVILDINGGSLRGARIAMGGVAHKPWRAREAEQALVGMKTGESAYRKAAEAALREARPYKHNAFKVELARRAVVRALTIAGGLKV
jgi:xanthine dehydrogenase YagS FAD-binding subunit